MKPLRETLLEQTAAGTLWKTEGERGVRCFACGHRCFIPEGKDGICKVRTNVGGQLKVPWGYVGGLQIDPIEKKPFFHVLPGSKTLSFGMLGCDFHCAYCQNWFTSQSLRDNNATAQPQKITVGDLLEIAKKNNVKSLTSTYNEPLITSEWAIEIFKSARKLGFRTSYVSNGNGTREVLEAIRPYVCDYKIDLKTFSDKRYRELGGVLKNVLETIEMVYQMGFWLEIVTLIIPGFNDDPKELKELADFISSVSKDIPWHVTAFHQDYKMRQFDRTTEHSLLKTAEIGKLSGLHFIYLGNLPGRVESFENTYCPTCKTTLIERFGYQIIKNRIQNGGCFSCHTKIPGRWE